MLIAIHFYACAFKRLSSLSLLAEKVLKIKKLFIESVYIY